MADPEEQMPSSRILALDVGRKRIGLAVSDELRVTAQGLATLERTRIRDDLQKLQYTIAFWRISMLLVGKPLHMSGSASQQSAYTEAFAERLGKHSRMPVVYWDERLTSAEAERTLKLAGATLDHRKKAVDKLAAVLLLESYLDFLSIQNTSTAGENLG